MKPKNLVFQQKIQLRVGHPFVIQLILDDYHKAVHVISNEKDHGQPKFLIKIKNKT